MGTHCKVAGRAENKRVRVIPTYKKCTKAECASIEGKSGGVGGATRKILKGEWMRMSFSGHFSRR